MSKTNIAKSVESPITSQPKSTNNGLNQTNNTSVQNNRIPNKIPSALDYLLDINQLLVQQKVEMFQTLTGFETHNQYLIKNSMGQQVFIAKEDTNICALMCCGPNRPFELRLLDNFNREVIHISRPLRCTACCCPCCLQYIEVESPPGNSIGYVEQDFSCCYPKFSVKDSAGERVLRISGPLCTFSILFNDVEFPIYSNQGYKVEVGRITKQWSGLLREAFTTADHYGVVFPMDLDVKIKACLLAAVFLIDFMYFERPVNRDNIYGTPGIHRTRGMHGIHGIHGANGINGIHGVHGINGIHGAHD